MKYLQRCRQQPAIKDGEIFFFKKKIQLLRLAAQKGTMADGSVGDLPIPITVVRYSAALRQTRELLDPLPFRFRKLNSPHRGKVIHLAASTGQSFGGGEWGSQWSAHEMFLSTF